MSTRARFQRLDAPFSEIMDRFLAATLRAMFILRNLYLQRGGRPLLDDVTLTFQNGQKIGLTGANGSGKSSLFALLRGEIHVDKGDMTLPARLSIGHVAQEAPMVECSAIDYVLDGDDELRALETAIEAAHHRDDGEQIAVLHARLDAIDGYTAPTRGARLLHGLGFAAPEHDKPVNTFSGGWRVRLNLARALMRRSDLLLLDEPTNHLDLDAVLWLEQWLTAYQGTLLLISHDRDFLDNTVDFIANIEQRTITLYKGNYAQFERQRAARLALQSACYDKQQREIAHLEAFITRFRAKASKSRQAQSRLKSLARMETIAAAHIDSPFHFEFREPEKCSDPLLNISEVNAGYDETIVLNTIELRLEPGARLGLLGRNGAGKSTLIKLLAGLIPPRGGELTAGQGLRIGYFAQHQLEQLQPDENSLQHLQRIGARASVQELRNFLGGFGFSGEDALRKVQPFSGGEKARLALALLVWQKPNLLLLDEPTNHLDLDMRDALNLALQEYAGALVIVSHDRHLLRTTCDRLMLVAAGQVQAFDGDLDDYRNWLSQPGSRIDEVVRIPQNKSADRKAQKRSEAEQRARRAEQRRPLEKRLQAAEKTLHRLNEEKATLERTLADPTLYTDTYKQKLKQIVAQQTQLAKTLHEAEETWLELSHQLEEK